MRTKARVSIYVIVPVLGLWVSGFDPASAEPSAECRDLAAQFAKAAAELDLRSLAGLMTCVSAELQDRAGGPAPAPSPRSPEDPPPDPAPAKPTSPPPTRERDQWPAPAPWGGAWPPAAPWDR
jgi:hypothetical protein